jgi:hypothetical protein
MKTPFETIVFLSALIFVFMLGIKPVFALTPYLL